MARTRTTLGKEANRQVQNVQATPAHLIDRFGQLDEQIKELQKEKDKLKEQILELGLGTHKGTKYEVSVTEYSTITLDPIKVAKRIGSKAFLSIVNVPVTKAKVFLSEQEMQECVKEEKTAYRVNVKKTG